MHHTIDKIPDYKDKKFPWQKKHLENQTGSNNSFKPIKIKKTMLIKNMKLGNKIFSILILIFFSFSLLIADEKITSTPLINIDKITPKF